MITAYTKKLPAPSTIMLGSSQTRFPQGIVLSLLLIVTLIIPATASFAAATPSLGNASSYAILASTFTNTTAGSVITGNIGFTTGPAVAPGGIHTNYGPNDPYAVAGSDQGAALSSLASQPCTFSFPAGAINLSTETTHGPVGVYAPGVYCSAGAMNIGGPLTLSGNGTFIFRAGGALTSTAGAIVSLSGASDCNIFWTPTQATTLGANTTFHGVVIDNAGITVGANTVWFGMALAFGGTVTTDTVALSLCALPAVSSSAMSSSAISSSAVSSSMQSSSALSSSSVSSQVSSMRSSSMRSSTASSIRSSMAFSSAVSSMRFSSMRSSVAPIVLAPVTPPQDPAPPVAVPTMVLPQTGVDMGAAMIALFGMLLAVAFSRMMLRNN